MFTLKFRLLTAREKVVVHPVPLPLLRMSFFSEQAKVVLIGVAVLGGVVMVNLMLFVPAAHGMQLHKDSMGGSSDASAQHQRSADERAKHHDHAGANSKQS